MRLLYNEKILNNLLDEIDVLFWGFYKIQKSILWEKNMDIFYYATSGKRSNCCDSKIKVVTPE